MDIECFPVKKGSRKISALFFSAKWLFQQRGSSSIELVRQTLIDTLPKILWVTIVNVFDGAFEVFVYFIIYPVLKGLLKLSQKLEDMR